MERCPFCGYPLTDAEADAIRDPKNPAECPETHPVEPEQGD